IPKQIRRKESVFLDEIRGFDDLGIHDSYCQRCGCYKKPSSSSSASSVFRTSLISTFPKPWYRCASSMYCFMTDTWPPSARILKRSKKNAYYMVTGRPRPIDAIGSDGRLTSKSFRVLSTNGRCFTGVPNEQSTVANVKVKVCPSSYEHYVIRKLWKWHS